MKHWSTIIKKNTGNILIVDDSVTATNIIQSILSKQGFSTKAVYSGRDAINLLNENHDFDLVVLDIIMPGISGIHVAQHIKKLKTNSYTPILFISQKVNDTIKREYLSAGGDALVSKPFNIPEFISKVNALLRFKRVSSHLVNLAEKDQLTGLFNHRSLHDKLSVLFESEKLNDLSVIVFDVDYFKKINDNYGHLIGDGILANVGKILLNFNPNTLSFPSRYGGEEFIYVLPNINIDEAWAFAENIRISIGSKPHLIEGNNINMTVSGGVASLKNNTPSDYVKLLQMADTALYSAKENGRNRIYKYSDLQNVEIRTNFLNYPRVKRQFEDIFIELDKNYYEQNNNPITTSKYFWTIKITNLNKIALILQLENLEEIKGEKQRSILIQNVSIPLSLSSLIEDKGKQFINIKRWFAQNIINTGVEALKTMIEKCGL